MARERLDIAPLRVFPGRKDLQAAEAVEEDGDAAEVGVLAKCDAPVVGGLRRCLDEPDLVSAHAVQPVETWQCLWWQSEMFVQEFEYERYNRMC